MMKIASLRFLGYSPGIPYNANAIQIHRLDVYAKEGDKFVSLLDMGEEIA